MLNIGILGLGTVGQGLVEIIKEREKELEDLLGRKINIKKILVRDLDKDRGLELDDNIMTDDFRDIIEDEEIEILVEVTSSLEEAYNYMKAGLDKGKHIVSANKAALSKYFEELSDLANEKQLALLYEASVGGGIPVVKPLKENLVLNEMDEIQGILNGTCNYILSRMSDEGLDYNHVLKEAQDLGYAEEDPSADVEGHDTLRKLRILASLGLGGKVGEEDIILEGIERIKGYDIEEIKKLNSRVKLIGQASHYEGGFQALVMPTIVEEDSYFASVNGAFNSVAFKGSNVGELKFYGPGAGKLPTANAVMSDLLDIGLNNYRKNNILGSKTMKNKSSMIRGEFYLRVARASDEIRSGLAPIEKKLLNQGDYIALVSKEVQLDKIYQLLDDLNIGRDEYFIGRFL